MIVYKKVGIKTIHGIYVAKTPTLNDNVLLEQLSRVE